MLLSVERTGKMPSSPLCLAQLESKYIDQVNRLYGYAMILTRNHAEAEDLVQETYLRAMQAMDKLRSESNLKGWLFTILRNLWLNQYRKLRTRPQLVAIDAGSDVIAEHSKDSYDLYVSRMEAEQVRTAIHKLPVEFREVIVLREYEELAYREIAHILDCPIGTVMSRLGRARARLRSSLLPPSLGSAPLNQGTAKEKRKATTQIGNSTATPAIAS
jgi:RNA polymerase sigma-70 factor (ECF subfamily)